MYNNFRRFRLIAINAVIAFAVWAPGTPAHSDAKRPLIPIQSGH